jgi:integrase
LLVTDVCAEDVSRYQQLRLQQGAAPKTVNLEVGTLRAILRRNKVWANIQQDVRMLPVTEEFGRSISEGEESVLLALCLKSRSRSLYPAVVTALNTGMRYSEVRLLTWQQVDLVAATVKVGRSKTGFGTGRTVPLSPVAMEVMKNWAVQFPAREPQHYVFPAERYGGSGETFMACAYNTNPSKPIGSFKKAWAAVKRQAKVQCRFHDLRHTACTRMLEAGVPFSVVASVMGWSPSTTIRMAKRYGHIGQAAQREAVAAINRPKNRQMDDDAGRLPKPTERVN